MNDSHVLFEASTWSELAEVLPKCMGRFKEQGEYNIFGYASIIGNHKDIQPAGSRYSGNNPKAKLPGMEVAMNVYAVGPNELRGTTDRENGIYNVGLYAGIEPALEAGGYTEGLNIKLTEEEAKAGISVFIKRELGNPPTGINLDDLFDANSGVKEKLAALPQDQFGLYKFQMVKTEENGIEKAALVVSTNEKSKYAAVGLTPIQTAHFILDGQGAPRLSSNGEALMGGTALRYFQDQITNYTGYGMEQPRMLAIKEAVFRLGYAYKKISGILESEHLPNIDKAKRIEEVCADFGIENVHSRVFAKDDQVAKRDHVDKTEFKNLGVPITGDDKLKYVAKLFEQRALDDFAANEAAFWR